jgi:serine protease Do
VVLGLLVTGACGERPTLPPAALAGATLQVVASQSPQESVATSRRTAIVDAVGRVGPAVVSINVTSRRRVQRSRWDRFFLPQFSSNGTGFVIRPDGVIITNQHVVAGAESIVVVLRDGAEAEATLVGEDPITDIAVLKIDERNLEVAPLGRSTDLLIGEWVVALGNPYGYLLGNAEPTVTAGVVSAVGRNIVPSGDQPGLYLDMIQTDAAINPGNSGGPLSNALGEVVGVNSSIFSPTGGSIGLGFAIPVERAVRVAEQLLRDGTVRRAWIGLEVAGVDAMRDWKTQGGVSVVNVAPGGPAERAGIRAGDVLTEADTRQLRNYLDWEAVKLDLLVGDSVQVSLGTDSRRQARLIVTADLPTVTAERVTVLRDLQLITVDAAIQSERGLESSEGALIVRISSSVSRATGLQEGDVILGMDRTRVRRAAQVGEFLNSLGSRQQFRVYFERRGRVIFTDLVFQ